MVTGEAMPVEKTVGDKVSGHVECGAAFCDGSERVGSETVLAQIVKLVSEAQRSRRPCSVWRTMVAAYFVPAVIATGCSSNFWDDAIWAGAAVCACVGPLPCPWLIIACPCAWDWRHLVDHGCGRTWGHAGVLIRNAEALENARQVERWSSTRTGTLTEGKPLVTGIKVFAGSDLRRSLLSIAASLERLSEIPLARGGGVRSAGKAFAAVHASEVSALLPGRGVEGLVAEKRVIWNGELFCASRE